jgi:hypothetical protein
MTGHLRFALGTLAVLILAWSQAAAQNQTGKNFTNREAEFPTTPASPRALPGARVGAAPSAAPAERTGPSDLSPNEALFDAINRGDLAAARDAVSRGAQLDAPNILGLTPIDLAIDLGRNEIMFMLLSMRPAIGSGSAPPPREARAAPRPAPRPEPRQAAPVRVPEPAPVRPRQHSAAADGAPVPSAGFLGFGGPGR